MRRLIVFNSVTLDGYFTGVDGDMSWAHKSDPEWNEFVAGNASGESVMLFGRVTYEMMAGWWPTPNAIKAFPIVAAKMNDGEKVVFSRTLGKAAWNNTRLVKGDLVAEVKKMKQAPGPGMVILGSGTIVSQLSDARLIDEYQVVINTVALGKGRTMFEGMKNKLNLKRTNTRAFGNGNILVCAEPIA